MNGRLVELGLKPKGSKQMVGRGGRSFAEERRLMALAASLKSLEPIASALGRSPQSVAKSAKRLGLSLKVQKRAKGEGPANRRNGA
jgi:hypothetical protein